MSDSVAEAARLEHEAEQLVGRARQMRARLTKACDHPFANLTFHAGASEHHMAHATERTVYADCSKCDGRLKDFTITWHKDF